MMPICGLDSLTILLHLFIVILYVRCGELSNLSDSHVKLGNNNLHILSDLIENFTYVMDSEVDNDLLNTTTSKFKSLLKFTTFEYGEGSLSVISALVPLTIIGAYKVQCHAVKDKLSKGDAITIQSHEIYSIAPWNTQLLHYLLEYDIDLNSSVKGTISPLELAIKLQNIEAVRMIVQRGGTFCESFTPLKCNNAIHYAIVNDNKRDLEFIINSIKKEYFRCTLNIEINFHSLLSESHAYDSTFVYTPLQISVLHCVIGLSCSTYSSLIPYLSPNYQRLSLPPRSLHSQTCPVDGMYINLDDRRWYVNSQQISGWKTYHDFKLGKNHGCGLPKINVHEIDFLQKFENLFVDLGVPVVIEGVTKGWQVQQSWKRERLLERWSHVDILAGPIPYGEVFGEYFGFATIEEFISYMDQYTLNPGIGSDNRTFKVPLYVFDSEVLQHHFLGQYNFTGLIVPSLRSSVQHHQFILGPAGSGAPFHFHCHAFNALVFGRKKWFLHPPSDKIYSKEHPLLWYMTKYAQLSSKPIECVQYADEVIYVPSMWSHATVNLDECIGVAVELDAGNC